MFFLEKHTLQKKASIVSMINNWLQLTHRTAIITGAGSGIGAAIAKAFSGQGCNVLLVDVNEENVKNVSNECFETLNTLNAGHDNVTDKVNLMGRWSKYVVCDITNKKEVIDMLQYADRLARESSPRIPLLLPFASILVNAAGITRDGLIHNINEEEFDKVLNTNLKGTFLTCQAFCQPQRLDTILGETNKDDTEKHDDPKSSSMSVNSASIINIGSIVSEKGNLGQTNYAASKGGVIGLTRALAKEMAFYSRKRQNSSDNHNHSVCRSNIRVNTILPGFIHTPMTDKIPDHVQRSIKNRIPLREFGTPDDIANMALFLASERSNYVTGSTLECSGMIAL